MRVDETLAKLSDNFLLSNFLGNENAKLSSVSTAYASYTSESPFRTNSEAISEARNKFKVMN